MKKGYIAGIVVFMFALILCSGYVLAKNNGEEVGFREVPDVFHDNTVHLPGGKDVDIDAVKEKVAQIISPYKDVSSGFMIHCKVDGNTICGVELTLYCKDGLLDETRASIQEQLAQFFNISGEDISITSVLPSAE